MVIRSPFTVLALARAMQFPVTHWPGNCYFVAKAMINHSFVKGRALYGMYHGPIHKDAFIFAGRRFTRHGWVLGEDGNIYDPTRWVFECKKPYIYKCQHPSREYDLGCSQLRELTRRPPPRWSAANKNHSILSMSPETQEVIHDLVPGSKKRSKLTDHQMFWLANAPPYTLGTQAEEIYLWLIKKDMQSWIPQDYREYTLSPGLPGTKKPSN